MKTNLLKNGAMPDLCPPVTPIECDKSGELFNANTLSNSVRVCLAAGEVAHLTAFKLAAGNTIKAFIDAKGNGVECANCGPDDRVPLMDCDGCHQNQLNEFKRQTYVVGPNCFVFVSDAPVGEPFVTMTKVALDQVPAEFICQEPCYPCLPVSVTTLATGETSANVTIVSGSDAYGREVTVKLFNGANEYEQVGVNGDVLTFAGLQPSTTYSVVATNDCSEKDTSQVTTATPPPCPAIVLSAVSDTTSSAVVTLTSGAPATVTLNGESQYGSGPFTFTGLTAGKTYTAFAVSDCGDGKIKASTSVTVQACPAVDFTALALSTTSVQVTATAGAPLTISVVDQSGNVLDSVDGVSSTLIFADLPDGAIVTVKAVNECGKTKQLNVKLPATPLVVSPCPSFSLSDTSPAFKGFAYVTGDLIDAAATVPFRGGFIYPTAGVGHTVKVTDALGVVIGYAANKSDCANPCCNQVSNRVSVDGGVIDDTTNNYFIYGEIKKCDDTNLELIDRVITKGDLLDCDGNPLPCDAKLKQCCDLETVVGYPTGLFDLTGCIIGQATQTDSYGRLVWRSRDDTTISSRGISSNGTPFYIQFDVTNPFECDALVEVSMQAHTESNNDIADNLQEVTYIHKVGEVLNVDPYPYGSTQWQADSDGWSFSTNSFNSDAGGLDGGSPPPTFPLFGGSSSQTTPTARIFRNIAAGQTITFYAQYWIVISDTVVGQGFFMHAGFTKNSYWKVTRGGRVL